MPFLGWSRNLAARFFNASRSSRSPCSATPSTLISTGSPKTSTRRARPRRRWLCGGQRLCHCSRLVSVDHDAVDVDGLARLARSVARVVGLRNERTPHRVTSLLAERSEAKKREGIPVLPSAETGVETGCAKGFASVRPLTYPEAVESWRTAHS